MRITYDPVAQAVYIYAGDTQRIMTREITDRVLVDMDADANVVGIEILGVPTQPEIKLLSAPEAWQTDRG